MPFKKTPPLYHVWQSMRDRCRNPKNRQWNDYGGRGISICDRWDSFQAFAADMGDRPPGHSIDRIDNNLGYSPENCRWATRKEQQRNQRRAVFVTIEGVVYRAIDLALEAGVKTDTIIERANRGLPYADVIFSGRHRADYAKLIPVVVARAKAKSAAKTHCPNGHEYNDANTYVTAQGWRRCRVCRNQRLADQRGD